MRTNTALLGAAAFAVGALSSATAQNVYSVNVVGYVNVPINHGLQIIGNPLLATDNSITGLFINNSTNNGASSPALGLTVYTWSGTGFVSDHNDTYGAGWTPNPSLQLAPGTGFFVSNGGATFTNTFVGTVVQGGSTNVVGNHLSLQSSQWPVGTNVVPLGLNANSGDTIYTWNGSGFSSFHLDTYGAGWSPAGPLCSVSNGPLIGVGQGFFYSNGSGAPFNWVQNFTVQ
jgi:hypothetical protein